MRQINKKRDLPIFQGRSYSCHINVITPDQSQPLVKGPSVVEGYGPVYEAKGDKSHGCSKGLISQRNGRAWGLGAHTVFKK